MKERSNILLTGLKNILPWETSYFCNWVFLDIRGDVHFEFLPPGQYFKKEYYLTIMRRLAFGMFRGLDYGRVLR